MVLKEKVLSICPLIYDICTIIIYCYCVYINILDTIYIMIINYNIVLFH